MEIKKLTQSRDTIPTLIALLEFKEAHKNQLVKKVASDQMAMNRILQILQEEKLINKKIKPGDKRIKEFYSLTRKGKKIAICVKECADKVASY